MPPHHPSCWHWPGARALFNDTNTPHVAGPYTIATRFNGTQTAAASLALAVTYDTASASQASSHNAPGIAVSGQPTV